MTLSDEIEARTQELTKMEQQLQHKKDEVALLRRDDEKREDRLRREKNLMRTTATDDPLSNIFKDMREKPEKYFVIAVIGIFFLFILFAILGSNNDDDGSYVRTPTCYVGVHNEDNDGDGHWVSWYLDGSKIEKRWVENDGYEVRIMFRGAGTHTVAIDVDDDGSKEWSDSVTLYEGGSDHEKWLAIRD